MKHFIKAIVLAIALGLCLDNALATNLYFGDIAVKSPSQRYKVEAKSPDNATDKGRAVFQSSFVYTCWDESAKKLLWTRKQDMRRNASGSTKEQSPINIFVSDTGWTVIRTHWDELIAVDLAGHDRTHIELLKEAFTPDENAKYVHHTTAGQRWSGYCMWYFLEVDGQSLFIVRPWWGRRTIVDLETGKMIPATDAIATAALEYERNDVLTALKKGVNSPPQWNVDHLESIWRIEEASYLAGRIPVEEAIPFLEELQDSPYRGSFGGCSGEHFEGKVSPNTWSTFTLRQVIHLSLRRLGKIPKQLPLTEFYGQFNVPYAPKPLLVARENNADKVKKGMSAEEVLDLLGAPDFVECDTWDYDLDTNPTFTLTLKWDVSHVIDVRKQTPALWKDSFVRDDKIMH